MKATQASDERGQSLWLDNITRDARRGQPSITWMPTR
jgi:hypothetical protein